MPAVAAQHKLQSKALKHAFVERGWPLTAVLVGSIATGWKNPTALSRESCAKISARKGQKQPRTYTSWGKSMYMEPSLHPHSFAQPSKIVFGAQSAKRMVSSDYEVKADGFGCWDQVPNPSADRLPAPKACQRRTDIQKGKFEIMQPRMQA